MKEIFGNIVVVDGDVLDRRDLHPDEEAHRQRQSEDVDAELRGIAMRASRAREQNIKNNNKLSQSAAVSVEPSVDTQKIPATSAIHVPREVLNLMIDAAYEEDELRAKGYSPSRIGTKVGVPLAHSILHLQTHGIDTTNAYGSSQLDEENNVFALDPKQARIDKMVDGGMSYYEATKRA